MIVNTILICYDCKRNVVFSGHGTWTDPGDPLPGTSKINFATFVKCHSCIDPVPSARPLQRVHITTEEVTEKFGDMMSRELFFALAGTILPYAVEDSASSCGMKVPIVDVKEVMAKMVGKATVTSIENGHRAPASSNFVDAGETSDLAQLFPTPVEVHSMTVCPFCNRNLVFSGFVSAYPLGPVILEGRQVTPVFFMACKSCSSTGPITDLQVSEKAIEDFDFAITRPKAVAAARKYFDGFVDSYRAGEWGGLTIIHRDVFVRNLKRSTEVWSLVDGAKASAHTDMV